MGSVCCCFHAPDVEENVGPNSSNNRNSTWLSTFIQSSMNKCGALFFGEGEMHANGSSIHREVSLDTTVAPNNMPCETNRSHGGSENSQLQQNAVVMRHRNSTGHSEPEPLRSSNVKISLKLFSGRNKHIGSSYSEGGSKNYCLESALRRASPEKGSVYPSSEDDEDVCPTCLEEYTPENPKIITQCSHHYHLSCIYEWMERSQNCPVCGKLMAFDEMT